MTTNHHTAISTGAVANASTFNSPLGQLDAAMDAYAATTAPAVLLATKLNVIIQANALKLSSYADVTALGRNTFIGIAAGNETLSPAGGTASKASDNTAVGENAGQSLTTGYLNVFIGSDCGKATTTGYAIVAVGPRVLLNNTTGTDNTSVGQDSMHDNIGGSKNAHFGTDAGYQNVSGIYNTSIGCNSSQGNVSGNYNTCIGADAGFNIEGSNNVCLGRSAGWLETGSDKFYLANNQTTTFVYGDFTVGFLQFNMALIGIGTLAATPLYPLDIRTSTASAGIHLTVSGDSDTGTYLNSAGTTEALLSGGANYSRYSAGYIYTAKATQASGIRFSSGLVSLWANDSLIVGNEFTPVTALAVSTGGLVGVGTESPATYLAGIQGLAVHSSGSSAAVSISSVSKYWLLYTDTSDINIFEGGVGVKATFKAGGSFLIGTATDGMTAGGSLAIGKDLAHRGTLAGFYNHAPAARPAKASHNNWVALSDVVAALVEIGLFDTA